VARSARPRPWPFGVARRASLRLRRDAGRRARRELALETVPAIADLAAEVRDRTLSFLRTEAKDRFARIRDTLEPEDRALLILRVDQDLSWNDCALALADGDDLAGPELTRASARLRKRFQVLKAELLELGRREGLVSRDGP
jgi:RNA polymerase sigma-70 factor (ECF subfamily)